MKKIFYRALARCSLIALLLSQAGLTISHARASSYQAWPSETISHLSSVPIGNQEISSRRQASLALETGSTPLIVDQIITGQVVDEDDQSP